MADLTAKPKSVGSENREGMLLQVVVVNYVKKELTVVPYDSDAPDLDGFSVVLG